MRSCSAVWLDICVHGSDLVSRSQQKEATRHSVRVLKHSLHETRSSSHGVQPRDASRSYCELHSKHRHMGTAKCMTCILPILIRCACTAKVWLMRCGHARAMARTFVVAVCLTQSLLAYKCNAQFAKQVVDAGLYSQEVDVTTAQAAPGPVAAQSSTTTTVDPQFYQPGVLLPNCPASNILLTDLGIPENWGELSAVEQAAHPANALIIQLAYAAWRDNPRDLAGCLSAMGVDASSMQIISAKVMPYGGTMTAAVMRAGSKAVFVAFRGTDFEDPGDILTDTDCAHTPNLRRFFAQSNQGKSVRLHTGFWQAWQALENEVHSAVTTELQQVDSNKRVYFIGHSLGAALAAIGALRFTNHWQAANSANQVAGVWLFGCPRIGNEGWQLEYNKQLLTKTLRMSNYADFASRLPLQVQVCPLTNLNGTFNFAHIGRSLVLCPNVRTGLVDGVVEGRGSERVDCGVLPEVPDLSIRTHWLGAYLDGWRRHHASVTGRSMQDDPRLANVICSECSFFSLSQPRQLNCPARAGGPISCTVQAACNNRQAWDAATLAGSTYSKNFMPFSRCMGYLCT